MKRAFTLVEMLVVVSIIGALAAILLPAIQQARESGRRAYCLNNMAQLEKGIVGYHAAKGFLPPARAWLPGPAMKVNWVVPILSFIDRTDLADQVRANAGNPITVAKQPLAVLLCGSDPESRVAGALSYRVNGGRANATITSALPSGGPVLPLGGDFLANGLFVDKGDLTNPWPGQDKAMLDRVRDGLSNTIMLSENLVLNSRLVPMSMPSTWAAAPEEHDAEIVWFPDVSADGFVGLNMDTTNKQALPSSLTRYARPASYHPGGFNMGFADGSVRFVSDAANYYVYAVMMASYGEGELDPDTKVMDARWQSPQWKKTNPLANAPYYPEPLKL